MQFESANHVPWRDTTATTDTARAVVCPPPPLSPAVRQGRMPIQAGAARGPAGRGGTEGKGRQPTGRALRVGGGTVRGAVRGGGRMRRWGPAWGMGQGAGDGRGRTLHAGCVPDGANARPPASDGIYLMGGIRAEDGARSCRHSKKKTPLIRLHVGEGTHRHFL